jgi:tetratricopeptide (TPR) repeat protein
MRVRTFVRTVVVVLTLCATAFAAPLDPAGARELAKQGYELKQQKQWELARQKYEESVRLDPSQKSLINLAECEAELGKLVDAQRHLLEARDSAKNDPALGAMAVSRLAAVEKRLPKLTVKLAVDAPSGTIVARDGVELQGASLATALPVDPGPHAVIVRSPGRPEQRFDVTLAEGETKELDVGPGAAAAVPVAPPPPPTAPQSAATAEAPASHASPLRLVGLVTAGVGVVGIAVGTGLAISANSGKCPNNVCATEEDRSRHLDARHRANIATIAFAAGGGLLAAGGLLWLLSPSKTSESSSPAAQVGLGLGDVVVAGVW